MQIDIKEEAKSDLKKKMINRWAKKRALLNKKPKFKIVTHNDITIDAIFHKVTEIEIYKNVTSKRDDDYEKSKFKCDKCMAGFDNDELFLLHNRKWHREVSCMIIFGWKRNVYILESCVFSYKRSGTHIFAHFFS